jgi:tetratricopeptide (TPR) repeat protein
MQIPPGLGPGCLTFAGAAVLDELNSDLGLLIWNSLRSVDVWARAGKDERQGLFTRPSAGRRQEWIDALAGPDPALRKTLNVLAGILDSPAPAPHQVALACAELARWANREGFTATAFEAAARAASAAPRVAAYCVLAGETARRLGDYTRAASWLTRTLRLARRTRDRRSYGRALLEMAMIHMVRYEREPAERRLHQAIRAARRHSLWNVRARAYHNLFCIQTTEGDVRTAAGYALAAAESYGLHHPQVPALAHDVALFLATHGRYERALGILEALAMRFPRKRERILAVSTLGRVSGLAGDRLRFVDAWSTAWKMLDDGTGENYAAEAMINLAWGAAALGDGMRMEIAAREALRIAEVREEGQEIQSARQMLAAAAAGTFPDGPRTAAGSDEELRDALSAAEKLLEQLARFPAVVRQLSA